MSDGPCLIPIFPGISAPSGVLFVGLAFVLRDLVQRQLGLKWAVIAIAVGALLSGLVSSKDLVFASVLAFAISETFDLLVYTPLQKRNFLIAVLMSGIVGAAVDSVVFVWIAFGSLDYVWGQIIGKLWMTLGAVLIISVSRR
ncbi:VUT family protein [Sulfitobacter sp.]|uniref:VUT family protein n=1 Tax=Sulfitobacter sp. TaxID=1903071 RepID=UPI00356B460C